MRSLSRSCRGDRELISIICTPSSDRHYGEPYVTADGIGKQSVTVVSVQWPSYLLRFSSSSICFRLFLECKSPRKAREDAPRVALRAMFHDRPRQRSPKPSISRRLREKYAPFANSAASPMPASSCIGDPDRARESFAFPSSGNYPLAVVCIGESPTANIRSLAGTWDSCHPDYRDKEQVSCRTQCNYS